METANIKVIEGLAEWEVMKRASEGEALVVRTYRDSFHARVTGWVEWGSRTPVWDWSMNQYAIIDTTTPEIDWDKFDWDFFNQYGGLPVEKLDGFGAIEGYKHVSGYGKDNSLGIDSTAGLRESPFYYWPGGDVSPVPDNVEVEYICRNGKSNIHMAGYIGLWKLDRSGTFPENDIIAFKITGKVL